MLVTRSGQNYPGFLTTLSSHPKIQVGKQVPSQADLPIGRPSEWCLSNPLPALPGNLGALMGYPSGTPGCCPPKGPTPTGTRKAKQSGPSHVGQKPLRSLQPPVPLSAQTRMSSHGIGIWKASCLEGLPASLCHQSAEQPPVMGRFLQEAAGCSPSCGLGYPRRLQPSCHLAQAAAFSGLLWAARQELGQGKQACDGCHFVRSQRPGAVGVLSSSQGRNPCLAARPPPQACPPSLVWRDPALPYLGCQQKLRPQL